MISVLLTPPEDPRAFVRLLTALVPAVAEGLVREVAVIGASGPFHAIADDAGAGLYDDFGVAFAKAKGPWLAGLPGGAGLMSDWMDVVSAHLSAGPARPARLTVRPAGFGLGGGPEGWLAPKASASSAVVVEQDLQRLARGAVRLRILERR